MKFSRLAEYFQRVEGANQRIEMADIISELITDATSEEIAHIIYLSQGQLVPAFEGVELGISEKLLIETLSLASNLPTTKIRKTFEEKGDMGETAEALLSGTMSINVEQVYKELYEIAMTSGKGSQEQKLNLLSSLLKGVTPKESKYIVRFVMGKLRLGVGDATVLDAAAQVEMNKQIKMIPMLRSNLDISQDMSEEVFRLLLIIKEFKNAKDVEQVSFAKIDSIAKKKLRDAASEEEKLFIKEYQDLYKLYKKLQSIFKEVFERANNICSDLGRVLKAYKSGGLDKVRVINVEVGYPVRMALCERAKSSKEALEKVRKFMLKEGRSVELFDGDKSMEADAFCKPDELGDYLPEVAVEGKYDGLRLQVHKGPEGIEIFSRNLERITHMFPDIVASIEGINCNKLIIEGEALAFNEATGELLPFQDTMQRKRKHQVKDKAAELPLKYFVFELLYLDGRDFTDEPYKVRRENLNLLLEKNSGAGNVEGAEVFYTHRHGVIDTYFEKTIEVGLEGVIVKRLDASYSAGARSFNWIKFKRSYRGELADSIDICIVGYYRGKGQRAKFGMGAVLGAVLDENSGRFKTITKVGSGFTEQQLTELEPMLREIMHKTKPGDVDSQLTPDFWVEPRYVISVNADEITRSPNHTAGMGNDSKGYALRFPRITTMPRIDKGPDETTTVSEIMRLYELQRTVKLK